MTPTTQVPSVEEISRRAAENAFGSPVVVNNLRGLVVETIVDAALSPEWTWTAKDWAGWDFSHSDGTRLEVKQSAAQQSWAQRKPTPARFDIAERTGRYEGATWVSQSGRAAHIYLFAYNEKLGCQTDHRDPRQWIFYVVPSTRLPNQRSIGLPAILNLSVAVRWEDLLTALERARLQL